MTIVPDTKDWTWVLTRPGGAGTRPVPGTWSALEYGCHVRDVFRRFDERLDMMLSRDHPLFPSRPSSSPTASGA